MKTTLTPPREWFYKNEETVRSMGFHIAIGDGDCIGLGHNDLFSIIDIYWDEEDPDTYSVEMTEDEDGFWECESEEELLDVLQEISENIDSYIPFPDYLDEE